MKTNYKAIGERLQIIREILTLSLLDTEKRFGDNFARKMVGYEAGDEIEKTELVALCDFYEGIAKIKNLRHKVNAKYHDVIKYGDVKEYKNILSLHIQKIIIEKSYKKTELGRILQVSGDTITNWINGKTLPVKNSSNETDYQLAKTIETTVGTVHLLIDKSNLIK